MKHKPTPRHEGARCQLACDPNNTPSFSIQGVAADQILQELTYGLHSVSFIVCALNGDILYGNQSMARGFGVSHPEEVIGKNLSELAPLPWVQERLGYMQLAVDRRRPLAIIEIISGTRLHTMIRPIEIQQDDHSEWVLLLTIEQITPKQLKWFRENNDSDDFIEAECVDLGKLDVLTTREIEVLAMIGQGLRQKQIAEILHRSVSTIDRHRERIGEKLGVTDRVELVILAQQACLEVSDANRTRTPLR